MRPVMITRKRLAPGRGPRNLRRGDRVTGRGLTSDFESGTVVRLWRENKTRWADVYVDAERQVTPFERFELRRLRYVGDAPRNDLVKVHEIQNPGPPSQPGLDDDLGQR